MEGANGHRNQQPLQEACGATTSCSRGPKGACNRGVPEARISRQDRGRAPDASYLSPNPRAMKLATNTMATTRPIWKWLMT